MPLRKGAQKIPTLEEGEIIKAFLKKVAKDKDDPDEYTPIYYNGLFIIFRDFKEEHKAEVIKNFTTIINNCTDSCDIYIKAFNKILSRLNRNWIFWYRRRREDNEIYRDYPVYNDIPKYKKYMEDVFTEVNKNCMTEDGVKCMFEPNNPFLISEHRIDNIKKNLKEIAHDNNDPKKYKSITGKILSSYNEPESAYSGGSYNYIYYITNIYFDQLKSIFYDYNDDKISDVIDNFTTILTNCTNSCDIYIEAFNKIWERLNLRWMGGRFNTDGYEKMGMSDAEKNRHTTYRHTTDYTGYIRNQDNEMYEEHNKKDLEKIKIYIKKVFDAVNKNLNKKIIDTGPDETSIDVDGGSKRKTRRNTMRKTRRNTMRNTMRKTRRNTMRKTRRKTNKKRSKK